MFEQFYLELTEKLILNENFEKENEITKQLITNGITEIVINNGSRKLKVNYIPTKNGTIRFLKNIKIKQLSHARLEYDIEFCNNFSFGKGGKLPGLGSNHPIGGGYKMDSLNWSARIMFTENNSLKTYIYHQEKKQKWGDSLNADFTKHKLKLKEVNRISIEVNLKSIKPKVTVTLNGLIAIEHSINKLGTLGNPESKIQNILFHTFHGGNDYSWTPKDNYGNEISSCAYIDNVKLYEINRHHIAKQQKKHKKY
jgi:hypothetical protein